MKIEITRDGKKPVSEGNIGLFFEDINYALDGGLYAELLENRNFEAKDVHGDKEHGYTIEQDGGYAWEAYPSGAQVKTKIRTDRPLFEENPHYMMLTADEGGAGICNKAYDGVYLKKGVCYDICFYARSYEYKGKLSAGFYLGGDILFEKKVKLKADGQWRKYRLRFKCKRAADRALFAVMLNSAGTVHLDCFSVMPADAVFGIFRRDLAEMMKALKPGFLRFPGGCVIEGNTLENRYLWKRSLGEKDRRRHNWNRWAVHLPEGCGDRAYSRYGQTLGVGFYEYFRLCEYIGAKPLPVVNVGIACQYASEECVPIEDPAFETYLQDALDLVEFARGDECTEWGKVRARMGHPAPFGLEYIGVGNEQWQTKTNRFYERFEAFEKRLHERYPDLKIIGTAGPAVKTPAYDSAWKWIRKRLKENENFVYCTDEHFYVPPQWLYDNVNLYDGYPREGKVFAGEYAAHIPEAGCGKFNAPQANIWEGALAEAAFMTGMERNSDVVVMSSYAPLFARLGYTQWSPDLIWFDGKSAYATASYYVQQLYSLYTGDESLRVKATGEKLYASATERDGAVYVKAVNASGGEVPLEIEGDFDFGALTRIITLSAAPDDYNTLENPFAVCPQDVAPEAERSLTLAPYSFNVLVFQKSKAREEG